VGFADNGSASIQNISLSDLIDRSRPIVGLLMVKVTLRKNSSHVKPVRSLANETTTLAMSPIDPSSKKSAQRARRIAGIMPYQRSIGSTNAWKEQIAGRPIAHVSSQPFTQVELFGFDRLEHVGELDVPRVGPGIL
jgi:hypothetical protein